MDQWNQRMMFPQSGMPQGIPQNVNNQQNFYRPTNPQLFYPHPPGAQFQSGFQPMPPFPQNMNPMPQNFPPASQPQPTRPMTPAELESLKKKRNFEEQQKRLMALKQGGGQQRTSQVGNPLNNLFGMKGNSGGMSSLLGSLGDVTRSKGGNTAFQGQLVSSSNPAQVPPDYITNTVRNTPAPGISNVGSPNWNTTTTAHFDPNTGNSQFSGDFEQFQGFGTKTVQDDFGDFQQSSGIQFPGNLISQQPEVPKSNPSDVFTPVNKTTQQPVNIGQQHIGDQVEVTASGHQSESRVNAPAAPSIEDLMKKSLMLDTQSPSSGRRFEKPKITKTIKALPKHFDESAKASKFENLDSLSEMFTIPQSALAHPVETVAPTSHVTANTGDDWSDFSSMTDTFFQEQNPTRPVHPTLESAFNWEGGNEGGYSTWKEPRGEMAIFSQPVSTVQTGPMWMPQVPHGSDGISAAPNIPVSQSHFGQEIGAGEFGGFQNEAPRNNMISAAVQEQGFPAEEVIQDVPKVDPEQLIYGVSLPEWSKNTNLLPAVYKQIHKICFSPSGGVISTSQLYPILLSSDLPRDKLGHIWSKCNKAAPGELNETELYLILGMVALAQVGLQVNKLTLEKLASCVTAPIPSFPENIFQPEDESTQDTPLPDSKLEQTNVFPTEPLKPLDTTMDNIFHPTPSVDAVKNPDWSRWKTSKAGQIDDKFSDFQLLMPKDESFSSSTSLSNVNWTTSTVATHSNSFGSFQSLAGTHPVAGSAELTNQNPPNAMMSEQNSLFGELPKSNEGSQSFATVDPNTTDVFGELTGASDSSQQSHFGSFQGKATPGSAVVMSVPLEASQRYTLTGEDESIDHHEKAWSKCLTSCFTVIMKSCQTLQNISDPNLVKEIFSSQQGISHFSAIIEIYRVSQRIKASVMKSAPNNKKLKENLHNIDNVWKTCLSFQPLKELLPMENFNFSGCHVNDGDDVSISCGVCLLNVDKCWMTSSHKVHRAKLSYGNRDYHTTCANFWCNKVDSVLPALRFNIANSLI